MNRPFTYEIKHVPDDLFFNHYHVIRKEADGTELFLASYTTYGQALKHIEDLTP